MLDEKSSNTASVVVLCTAPDEATAQDLAAKVLAEKLAAMDKAGASNDALGKAMGGLRGLRLGMLEDNTDEGYIALGTGIGNIHGVKSVAEVVNALTVE